jgi:cysteine synthase B
MIGSALGYRVLLALPANASKERKQTLQAYGAEIVMTDPLAGTDGAQKRVKEMVSSDPGKYFYPDQYNNPANWRAHYYTTALEIWTTVAGLPLRGRSGTTGTFVGTSRRLKELAPTISCFSMEPMVSHGLED